MKDLAGYAMCFAAGNMMFNDLVLAGLAIGIAGFGQLLNNKEAKNA